MPETPQETVDRIFREHKRYTGDGLPNEPVGAPLPVGDPASGAWNPKKAHLRVGLLAPLDAAAQSASEAGGVAGEAGEARDQAQYAAASVIGRAFILDVPTLLADDNDEIGYVGSGARFELVPGNVIRTQKEGFGYELAASYADDPWLMETAGGVKLEPLHGAAWEISAAQFGCKNDGTDTFEELQKLAAFVNAKGGGIVTFPRGTYYADRFIGVDEQNKGVLHFIDCKGLVLLGDGVRLSVKGDIHRAASGNSGVRQYSGIKFTDCTDIIVRGFEIDGNSQLMTKAPGVTEGDSHALNFESCIRVHLENLDLHHFQTDGLYVRESTYKEDLGHRVASKFFTGNNVSCRYNGRQGFSAIQLRHAHFRSCEFSFTGRSPYGGHSPGSGVDIEPNRRASDPGTDKMDVTTGDITFENFLIKENEARQFITYGADRMDHIHLLGGEIDAGGDGSQGTNIMFHLDGDGSSATGVKFNTRGKNCEIYWGQPAGGPYPNERSIYSTDCTFEGSPVVSGVRARYIRVLVPNTRVLFRSPKIRHAPASAVITDPDFIFVDNGGKFTCRDAHIFVAKEAFATGGVNDGRAIGTLRGLWENVLFETDLPADQGGASTAHFFTNWGNPGVGRALSFKGTARGVADTFRINRNSSENTTNVLSRNPTLALD